MALDDLPPFAQFQAASDFHFDALFAQYQSRFRLIPQGINGPNYRWYRDAFTHAFTSAVISYSLGSATAALLGSQREHFTNDTYDSAARRRTFMD